MAFKNIYFKNKYKKNYETDFNLINKKKEMYL